MIRIVRSFVFSWLGVVSAVVNAQHHKIEVDDYFKLGYLNEVSVSSSGQAVAYTEARWQEATNDRKNDIWIASFSGNDAHRLTFDRAGYDTLRWSSSGKYLFYASQSRKAGETSAPFDGTRQVWRMTLDGGAVIPVTRIPGGIDTYELTPSGDAVICSSSSDFDQGDWATMRSKFSKVKYGTKRKGRTTLSRVDLETWRTTQIGTFDLAIDSFAIAPGNGRIAMVTALDASVVSMEGQSKMTILDVTAGSQNDLPDDAWRKQLPSPYGRLAHPTWSSDGNSLAFGVGFDAYPSEIFVATWSDLQPKIAIRKIDRPEGISVHGGVDGGISLSWRPKTKDLYFLGDDHARVRVLCATDAPNGGVVNAITNEDVVIDSFGWSQSGGHIAAIKGGPLKMHDVFLYDLKDKVWTQLTDIHAHTKDWQLPKISIVKWLGDGDTTIEGVLELPESHQNGKPLPLIVNLHGGPTSAWGLNMQFGYTGNVLFAGQGYAFFSPNYRGSTGYGDAFITALVGRENDIEVNDILKGVDKLIADGIADKDRIAVAGWSNGGYLTNCLIAKTDRFKAASSGAGIIDQAMEWGTNDEPAFPTIFSRGTPWDRPAEYRRASPIYSLNNVKTPTLFHVGENDPRCPKGHSEAGFRALKDYLNVESELLVYPGETHGLASYSSRKAKMSWDLAWFDHFLKGRPKP